MTMHDTVVTEENKIIKKIEKKRIAATVDS